MAEIVDPAAAGAAAAVGAGGLLEEAPPRPPSVAAAEEEDDDEEEGDVCRICRNRGDDEHPLRYPCACSGSIKFVHQDCLLQWLDHSNSRQCELMAETPHVVYAVDIYCDKIRHLVDPAPERDYALETAVDGTVQKFLYLRKFPCPSSIGGPEPRGGQAPALHGRGSSYGDARQWPLFAKLSVRSVPGHLRLNLHTRDLFDEIRM